MTKRKKDLPDFYTIRKITLVSEKKNGWWGQPEILGQPAPVGAKSPIFSRYSLVVPQW